MIISRFSRYTFSFILAFALSTACQITFAQTSAKEVATKSTASQTKSAVPVPPKEDIEKLINLTLSLVDKATDPVIAAKARVVATSCYATIGKADEAISRSDKFNNPLDKACLRITVAYNLIKENKLDEAKKCVTDALGLLGNDGINNIQSCWVLINAANALFSSLNSPKDAIVICDKLCENLENRGIFALARAELSWRIYLKSGEYAKAILLMQAIKRNLFDFECKTYCEIAAIKAGKKDAAGCKEAIEKAQAVFEEKLSSDFSSFDFIAFIKACKDIDDIERAKQAINKYKIKVETQLNKEKTLGVVSVTGIRSLAKACNIIGDKKMLGELEAKIESKKPTGNSYFDIADYYMAMIEIQAIKGDYSKSMAYFDEFTKRNDSPEETGGMASKSILYVFDDIKEPKDVCIVMDRMIAIPPGLFKRFLIEKGIKRLCELNAPDEAKKYLNAFIKEIDSAKKTEEWLSKAKDSVCECFEHVGNLKAASEFINSLPDTDTKLNMAIRAFQLLPLYGDMCVRGY